MELALSCEMLVPVHQTTHGIISQKSIIVTVVQLLTDAYVMPLQVQLDPAYQAPELLHSLTKVGVKALISMESYKTSSSYQILRALIPELDNCPESGDQLRSAKVPSLQSLIIMSDRQYR
jgi:fatty-acyl-CoA synthase